jgi:hypothetical protein
MATVLEEYTIEERNSLVHFLWEKEIKAKDIYKEIFAVYGGKFLLREVFHHWEDQDLDGWTILKCILEK